MKLAKHTICSLALCALLFLPTLPAHAAGGLGGDFGLRETATEAELSVDTSVDNYVGTIIGGLLSMIAVIFFLIVVYGGFLWMTAHGDSDQVNKARDTLIAGIVGIIISLSAFAISNFIFSAAGG